MRVQIPAYSHIPADDRLGEVVKVTAQKPTGIGRMLISANAGGMIEVAHVRLDKSGKVISVLLDDCVVVS